MKDFAKLIFEGECLLLIKVDNKKLTKQELIKQFLSPSIQTLYDALADNILMANLKKEHFYRFEIIVHAQQKEDVK